MPENLVSRDGFDSPVPRQPANLHTQAESGVTYGIPPEFHGGVHLFIYNRHIPSGQSRVYRVTQKYWTGRGGREVQMATYRLRVLASRWGALLTRPSDSINPSTFGDGGSGQGRRATPL